ncbi:unnamed protein product, partial [Bubo scandiacus]
LPPSAAGWPRACPPAGACASAPPPPPASAERCGPAPEPFRGRRAQPPRQHGPFPPAHRLSGSAPASAG